MCASLSLGFGTSETAAEPEQEAFTEELGVTGLS